MRYVRLFYGAMLKFADKHLHSRYSWVMKEQSARRSSAVRHSA
jgi:hypothetical protein